jgi:hypothetical protein
LRLSVGSELMRYEIAPISLWQQITLQANLVEVQYALRAARVGPGAQPKRCGHCLGMCLHGGIMMA